MPCCSLSNNKAHVEYNYRPLIHVICVSVSVDIDIHYVLDFNMTSERR